MGLFWVGLTLYLALVLRVFNSRLVETLKLAGGLTLRCVCVCSFVREGFMVYDCLSIYIYIHRQFALRCSLGLD